MDDIQNIYLTLPNNSSLSLYKRQGILKIGQKKIRIDRDIANVIQLCLRGLPLNEAIIQYCAISSEKDKKGQAQKKLLGILGLVADNLLITSPEKNLFVEDSVKTDEINVFYPQSMHVELTKTCNLNCYYCYRYSGPSVKETRMSVKTLLGIIENLSERGLNIVELTGGEPLLHPNFMEILEFCCKHLSLVSIITNGTLIDEDFIKKIKPLKNKVIFSISLDSYREKEHEMKSGIKGSFQKAVDAIKLIAKENMIVKASMAVDEKNWNQIEDTLLFAKSIGATKFTYSPIIPVGRAHNKKGLFGANIPVSKVADYEKYLIDTYSDFLHILDGYSQQELNSPGGCGIGHRTFVMNPQGDIRLCATFENGVIGNVLKQPLKDVFSNSVCELSAQITPPTFEVCKDCYSYSFCMGCSLRAVKGIEEVGVDNCYWLQSDKVAKEWFLSVQ